ncbi:hypothetical protein MCGE09_00649 [Thaumarchaeota archaeon SCGC AB-539-E09]|nr:hypothetical protein MCGE09_00649 [Thaumarchaeota archaeon SCGC AB-539-E09]
MKLVKYTIEMEDNMPFVINIKNMSPYSYTYILNILNGIDEDVKRKT